MKVRPVPHSSLGLAFPDVVAALRDSPTRPRIVNGEGVCLDEHGRSSSRVLQQRLHLKNTRGVAVRMQQQHAHLYPLDPLDVDAYDRQSL